MKVSLISSNGTGWLTVRCWYQNEFQSMICALLISIIISIINIFTYNYLYFVYLANLH